ncbi:MAG: hypothetical protein ACYTET_08065 [Planctomycetota bacterium]|jgi:hypothetical protein
MFKTNIKRVAVQIAVLIFFVMALTGWISGHPIATCASRALLGAVAIYCIVRVAGQLVVKVIISALVDEQVRQREETNQGQ